MRVPLSRSIVPVFMSIGSNAAALFGRASIVCGAALFSAATPAITTATPANTVLVTTFGQAGQGGDDTSAFLAGINATASAGQTLEIPAGSYHVSTLSIPSNAKILLDSGATVTANSGFSSNQHLIDIDGASNVSIGGTSGNSIFQMLKSEYTDGSEYRDCISIFSSNSVTINGISCNSAGGDGIHIAGGSSNISVTSSTFDNNGRNGMSVISVNGLMVDHCSFTNTAGNSGLAPDGPWDGIDMEPNVATDELSNITVQNSTVSGNAGNGITVSTDKQSAAAGAISITLNSITSIGNGTSGDSDGDSGFAFFNGLNNSPNNQYGTVLLENSTSANEGGWGVVASFWDYSNAGVTLTVQNVTITNPHQ
jgi:hypothetical protein